jgi:hypothetical protein
MLASTQEWVEAGITEVIPNNLNPRFAIPIKLEHLITDKLQVNKIKSNLKKKNERKKT